MPSQLAFAIFSLIVIIAAWRVVTSPNVVRAALALVIVLAGIAPIFLMLAAEFVAVVQVLVYVGAVVVLFLFAIMVTPSSIGSTGKAEHLNHRHRWPGAIIGALLFGILWAAIRDSFGDEDIHDNPIGRTAGIGISLFRDHVIEFEVISVLLLAVLVGAVAMARRD